MIWTIWIVAGVLALIIFIMFLIEDRQGQGNALAYRQQYVRLTGQLESVVGVANQLGVATTDSNNLKVLDTYHSHLKVLETILEAVKVIPPFSTKLAMLKAPMFLVSDLSNRLNQLASDIYNINSRRQDADKLEPAPLVGCYFCSRPFHVDMFHKVRVKVEGSTQDVAACNVCNGRLISGKKAKVLFFAENGDTVHWSKTKDYVPSAQFWNINETDLTQSQKQQNDIQTKSGNHLTLVYSNVTKLSSDRNEI
ncbi:MAG: hypothetical protein NT027_05680 [Proteobacteria bacterium]|nr:hypothetical protein [Pseudomonadota bacterium]